MNKNTLTDFGLRRPGWVWGFALVLAVFFLAQFPKVTFDNDPENMLAEDEYIRVFHNSVKRQYALYDFVIVGIVNRNHPDGVFNVDTLGRIDDLTRQLISLRRGPAGRPEVIIPARAGRPAESRQPDLRPRSAWARMLAVAFRQDAERLFTPEGASAIIVPEIISPSVVDNLRQADLGRLKIEYLMEEPPATRAEALRVRDDALGNPLYRGTMVSSDGRALAVYIPLVDKTYSHNVANLVESLTAEWSGDDEVYITGQPVAQDTFGVEMLVQMATSAPLAALAIFLLLYAFFRRVSLILAPMVVAMLSVIFTMGLLIGLGYDVHIMSSMIAIFLMPIAVADAIHMLSEFYDVYPRFRDKQRAVRYVVGHLFQPMLYTSLTTMAGFASLAATPIPPVRVFGLHVAFGVGVAWLLTMTLIPAYIMLLVPEKALHLQQTGAEVRKSRLQGFLGWLGGYACRRWRGIIFLTLAVMAVSVYGITRISVNDNPVKWFSAGHRIRVADDVLNGYFDGTYTAYLTLRPPQAESFTCHEKAELIRTAAVERFGAVLPEPLSRFLEHLDRQKQQYGSISGDDLQRCFVELVNFAGSLDDEVSAPWRKMGDAIIYLDPDTLTADSLRAAVSALETVPRAIRAAMLRELDGVQAGSGAALQDAALAICDRHTALSFREFVYEMEAEISAPTFKQPAVLHWVAALQQDLLGQPVVGKSSSAVDALMKANYELNFLPAPADAAPGERVAADRRNRKFYAVPDNPSAVGQVFTQLEGMKKRDSLFHMVTRDYQGLNIWVQLRSGDNKDMQAVVEQVADYISHNPPPTALEAEWAGLTYLNVVWQDRMVWGMLNSLGSSFVVVLVMMMLLFRSPLFGLLSMVPLSVTIMLIYGLIGLTGKDYDMPVAILSALTLGLSVDFAIHFLERARELQKSRGSWAAAAGDMFREPAMAISRNAIVISVGFLPLLLAPLVPYRTVGVFLATIMAVSWLATLFLLAALVTALAPRLFGGKTPPPPPENGVQHTDTAGKQKIRRKQ